MDGKGYETPILFIVFNRPDCTQKVFERIRSIQPKKLFVAADGPRLDKAGEKENCDIVRKVVSEIDWNCDLKTLFREENFGCKKAVSNALDWFFAQVEEGIVLEDDCLPDLSFFRFCQELLEKYRDDTRVMHIAGTNFHGAWCREPEYSYYFSNFGSIWGWASWKRAWKLYDVDMTAYPEIKRKEYLKDICRSKDELEFRISIFDQVSSGQLNTWDYQWTFARLINSGLSIVPKENLITNIGFSINATHTNRVLTKSMSFPATQCKFPLKHPVFLIRDTVSDMRFVNFLTSYEHGNSIKKKIKKFFLKDNKF